MRYRFTLSRIAPDLCLDISEWDGGALTPPPGELLTTQIVEDFMPRAAFRKVVAAALDAPGDGLRLVWPFSEAVCHELIGKLNGLASPERYGRVADDYTGVIGRTPLVRLPSVGADCPADVLLKLECMEPNSVKDRPIYSILEQAIARGEIDADTEVVEASSGNVAFAVCAILQVLTRRKPTIFISKMHGPTKARAVRVSGAPVMLTNAAEGTASAKRASVAHAESRENTFQVNQHDNPDNPRAHRLTTGPELFHQCHTLTGQAPAEFVAGLGTGGTAVGVALFRDDIGADFKVIGVEPEEASLLTGGEFHAHRFSGLAPGFVTGILERDRHRLDGIETVTWQEGFAVCRRILVEEGYLVGPTTGAAVAVALRRGRLPENRGRPIVAIAPDRGDRYLSIEDLYTPPESAVERDLEAES